MTIPVFISRPAALGVGVTIVLGTSLLIPEPYLRTLLVWVGFFPVLWALRPLPGDLERTGSKNTIGAAAEKATISLEKFERAARRVDGRKGALGRIGSPRSSSRIRDVASATTPPESSTDSLSSALLTPQPTPAAGNVAFSSPRKYIGLRRMTEQYLREIRRMNLVAVWGREGAIPKRQALDQIREIEGRMQYLSGRMKLVAGRVRN